MDEDGVSSVVRLELFHFPYLSSFPRWYVLPS